MYVPDPLKTLGDLLQLFHVRLHLFKEPYENIAEMDFHLREELYKNYDYRLLLEMIREELRLGQTQTHQDIFGNYYLAFSLATDGQTDGQPNNIPAPYEFAVIGPFRYRAPQGQELATMMEKHGIPASRKADIMMVLGRVPIIRDREMWKNMVIYMVSRMICKDGELDYSTLSDIVISPLELSSLTIHDSNGSDTYRTHSLADGYTFEEELRSAVMKGNSDQAGRIARKYINFQLSYYKQFGIPAHYTAIDLNTLLRRAAIESGVNMLRLDEIFIRYNRLIHQIEQQGDTLQMTYGDMVADYCKLIKRYSRQNFSTPVRKCMDYLDFHFQEQISLHTVAQILGLSDGYLSTAFRKEVGTPLTEYLQQNRVQYAKILLVVSELSVQEISSECGFSDASYFARIFKKYTGKAPKQYRAAKELL